MTVEPGRGLAFLDGGGEASRMIRDRDWTRHPLGPLEGWPPDLRSALSLVLNSPESMILAWGEGLHFFFNDTYFPLLGPRLPWAMGERFDKVWADAWDQARPIIAAAMAGQPKRFVDLPWKLGSDRGAPDTWWTFSYSRVLDGAGDVAGLFILTSETTDRVLKDAALRESEERLRLVIEGAKDHAIITTDPAGSVTSWSAGAQATFGWPFAEVEGRSIAVIFTPEDRATGAHQREISIAAHAGFANDERWHITREGQRVFMNGSVHPLPVDAQGRDRGFIKIARNETERWQAHEALRVSERSARENAHRVQLALAAGAIIGTWMWDLPTDRFSVDEAFARAFGLDPALDRDGIPLATIVATVHPDDQAGLSAAIDAAIARGGRYAHQYRVRRHDGRYYWLEANGHVEHGPDGKPLRFPGVLIDVEDQRALLDERDRALTDLRRLNETLEMQVQARTAELRIYRDIVQSDPSPILAFDTDHRLIGCNQAHLDELARVTGLSQQVGDKLPDLFPPDRAAALRGLMDRALAGESFSVIERFGVFEGVSPPWDITYMPLRDEGDRIVGAFHRARDVSARQQAERELNELQEQLRQSQKMEAVGQLTGGVAHDFNNLLTIIRSSVDFLRRPNLPETRRERYLNAVSDTVDRAAKLTGQLLAFARRQALKPEVFEVGAKLRGIGEMLDTVTGARIRVRVELPDRPCFVRADVSQFETALINMAVNARDAMNSEGRLTLKLDGGVPLPSIRGHAPSTSAFAAVAITDTGQGIPPEQLAHIFEPFFTTKEVGKGTGLGLSQVFGFAKQSGGDVAVASQPPHGTTFTLFLPEVEAEAGGGQEADTGDRTGGAGQKVLIVEDNVEVGRFTMQIVQDLGYQPGWAVNAEEALVMLGQDGAGFQAVFTDVVMPGMGGIALAEHLSRRLPHLPVVLTSGYSHVLAQEGGHGFELLHKPYSAEQLAHVLARLVRPAVSTGADEPTAEASPVTPGLVG